MDLGINVFLNKKLIYFLKIIFIEYMLHLMLHIF